MQIPRLLVIEDDTDTAMLISDVLTDHFDADCVCIVSSIEQALACDLGRIDLVLSDFHLPDGDGLVTLEKLLGQRPDLPIIMVTGETEITTAIKAIHAGAADYVVKSAEFLSSIPLIVEKILAVWRIKRENRQLQRQLQDSYTQIKLSNTRLAALVRQLEEAAMTDALTGLSNRRHFNETLSRMFAESTRYGSELSCIMMDVDNFKQINDSLGHQRGDELLRLVGRIIAANSREADVPARYGGDEFVMLLPQTDIETAVGVGQRLQRELALVLERFQRRSDLQLGVSIGIACTTVDRPTSPEHLVTQADRAMYAAKKAGKGTIMIHGPEACHPPAMDPPCQRQSRLAG